MATKRGRGDGYYQSEYSNAKRERVRGGLLRVILRGIDVVMMIVSVVAVVGVLSGCLARVVDPRSTAIFTLAGLFYQIFYYLTIGCALWWAIRWRRWFFAMAAVLLVSVANVGLIWRPDMVRSTPEVERTRDDIVMVSYNVANFKNLPTDEDCYEGVCEWLGSQNAGIIALQEAEFTEERSVTDLRDRLPRINYSLFVNAIPEQRESRTGCGYALLSTWPIVRHGVADSDENNVNAIWADLKIGRDTVRVVNVHLQSTGISYEERFETLSAQIVNDTLARTKLLNVAEKMAENYRIRAGEAESVATVVADSPHAVVVCGDFNDTPVSYTYRTMRSRKLDDAFVSCGRGVEYTYRGLYDLFRIDYILPESERFDIKEYGSYDLDYSDHKAISARLLLIEEE